MRRRWNVAQHMPGKGKGKGKGEGKGKAVRYVLEHYFIASSRPSRALTRNGMSRLWWYAALTHDPDRSNPYELTRVLLSSLDIAQQLLERNLGRAPNVRTAFLEYLMEHEGELGDSARHTRNHIRFLAERLNLRGGINLLDSLDVDEITELLTGESRRWEAALQEQ